MINKPHRLSLSTVTRTRSLKPVTVSDYFRQNDDPQKQAPRRVREGERESEREGLTAPDWVIVHI